MGGKENGHQGRAGETKKKLTAQRDKVAADLQRWATINRRSSHPCDRSEVGRWVYELQSRRDALTAQIDRIDEYILMEQDEAIALQH